METKEQAKPHIPQAIQFTMDLDLANMLSWAELVFALHDAGILDKQVVADRLRKLCQRKELNLNETTKRMLDMRAQGLEQSGEKS